MKTFNILMFFLILFNNSCRSNVETKYYKDFDSYQIIGINEIPEKELTFPYLKIDFINDSIREVSCFFDKESEEKLTYIKKNNYWIIKISENTKYENCYYQIIKKDTILGLTYTGDPDTSASFHLESLEVFTKGHSKSYVFYTKDSINLAPSPIISDYPIKNTWREGYEDYIIENGKLKIHLKTWEVKTGKIFYVGDRCYKIKRFSFFWWSMFFYKFESC